MTHQQTVATPAGPARLWADEAERPRMRLVLGHGAGGGVQARDLVALAQRLPEDGISVVRVEQPWRVAGKKIAPRPAALDDAWLTALDSVPRDVPLVCGGRSAGARVACRTARSTGARAVVALAFPLHPPGKPERSRLDELLSAGVPALVMQGTRDTFGRPDEIVDALPSGSEHGVTVVPVAHADHGMSVLKAYSQAQALARIVRVTREFLAGVAG